MIEKTPRKLAKKAQAHYGEHKDIEHRLADVTKNVSDYTSDAQYEEGWAKVLEKGGSTYRHLSLFEGHSDTPEKHRTERDEKLKMLGGAVLIQGELMDESDAHLDRAYRHYRKNESAYHDLAILESAMDGVEINVQQIQTPPEQIEVRIAKQ